MNRVLPGGRLLALVLALCCTAFPACGLGESDGDILTEISNRMHADPAMEGINAAVADGVVTLTGTCADEPCRQHAADAVRNVKGVKQVINSITLAGPPAASDTQLLSDVQAIVGRYPGVSATVRDGVVTLSGKIQRDSLPSLMNALTVLRPKRIDNKLDHEQ